MEGTTEQSDLYREGIMRVRRKRSLSWTEAVLVWLSWTVQSSFLSLSAPEKEGFSWKLRPGKDEWGNLTRLRAAKGSLMAQF